MAESRTEDEDAAEEKGQRRWLDLSISRESNRFLYESEQINRKNQAIKSLSVRAKWKQQQSAKWRAVAQGRGLQRGRGRGRGAGSEGTETEELGTRRKYQNGNKWCWYPAKRVKTLTMPPKLVNHKNYCMRWNKLRWRHWHRHRSGCTTIAPLLLLLHFHPLQRLRATELSVLLPIPRILAAATTISIAWVRLGSGGRQWRRLPAPAPAPFTLWIPGSSPPGVSCPLLLLLAVHSVCVWVCVLLVKWNDRRGARCKFTYGMLARLWGTLSVLPWK